MNCSLVQGLNIKDDCLLIHKRVNLANFETHNTRVLMLVAEEIVEMSLRDHPVKPEQPFEIHILLTHIFHDVSIKVIEIKMHADRVLFVERLRHIELNLAIKDSFHAILETNLEVDFYPALTDPTIFNLVVEFDILFILLLSKFLMSLNLGPSLALLLWFGIIWVKLDLVLNWLVSATMVSKAREHVRLCCILLFTINHFDEAHGIHLTNLLLSSA